MRLEYKSKKTELRRRSFDVSYGGVFLTRARRMGACTKSWSQVALLFFGVCVSFRWYGWSSLTTWDKGIGDVVAVVVHFVALHIPNIRHVVPLLPVSSHAEKYFTLSHISKACRKRENTQKYSPRLLKTYKHGIANCNCIQTQKEKAQG